MSKLQSHFYVVKGTPKGKLFPTMGWLFHSYKELEDFAQVVVDIIPKYDLEIVEEHYSDMMILDTWEIN